MIKHKDLPVIQCERSLSTDWWNYISIYRDTQSYRLYLNDTECGRLDIESEYNDYQLFKTIFIGGVPQTLSTDIQRLIGCIGDVNIDGSLINFNNVIKLKNAEQNCQTNVIGGNNNNNNGNNGGGPTVYPPFDYNATQPSYPDGFKLKLLEFSDNFGNFSTNSSLVLPSVGIIDELTSSQKITTATVTKSMSTVSMEKEEIEEDKDDEDEDTSRNRRSCSLPTVPSNNRGQDIGYRFGDDHRESRGQITITEPSISYSMNISFKFRTRFTHGLLFYSGSDGIEI